MTFRPGARHQVPGPYVRARGRLPELGLRHRGEERAACLRFLFGALLDDPRGVLRPGTSSLQTIDYASLEEVDPQLVADYIAEAVARHDESKAVWRERKGATRA